MQVGGFLEMATKAQDAEALETALDKGQSIGIALSPALFLPARSESKSSLIDIPFRLPCVLYIV